ncbi:MAG: hypothetical protein LLG97_18915 [Deltaproteobacteria bacterium]|nr:hypothetical protein [Deltaproteobacteria bacterium]
MKNRTKIIIVLSMMFLVISVTAVSNAVVVKFLNLTQLTSQADLIFHGRVTAVHASWDDSRTAIWTSVTFAVDEVIKGDLAENVITLRLPGGAIEADDIRMEVDGVPKFRPGEETVIFCSRDSQMRNPIIGWHQGQFKIRDDKLTGGKLIDDKRASRLMTPARTPASSGAVAPGTPLKSFIEEIKRIKNLPLPD